MGKVEFDFDRMRRQLERLEEMENLRRDFQNTELTEVRRLAGKAWSGETGQDFERLMLRQQEKTEGLSTEIHRVGLLLEEACIRARRMEEQAEEIVENHSYN